MHDLFLAFNFLCPLLRTSDTMVLTIFLLLHDKFLRVFLSLL